MSSENLATVRGTAHWGPFLWKEVVRTEVMSDDTRRLQHQLQVTCPFHNDVDDAPGTRCTRTHVYSDGNRSQVVRQLKMWCLQGRHCLHRAANLQGSEARRLSHKFVKVVDASELKSDTELNEELRVALMASHWIIEPQTDGDGQLTEVEGDASAS